MNQDNHTHTLDARVEHLERTSADHEQRLAALETRLDPNSRQQRMAADLDLLLDELAGLGQDKGEGVK